MKENSICLVMPYFGRLPNYFQFWLSSCRYNPTVDFLLLTDDRTAFDYPRNVHVEYCSFGEVAQKIRSVFDYGISLERPYKLCDYKPVYGAAFADRLKDYSFWGHCDCDLIFGNLRHFIADDMLERYDKLFTRGWLTLYRNTEAVNRFFFCSPNSRKVFTSAQSFAFDENGGMTPLWCQLAHDRSYDELIGYDVEISKMQFTPSSLKWREKDSGRDYFAFNFDHGRLKRYFVNQTGRMGEDEVGLVHFQKRPMKVLTGNVENFMMIPNEFRDYVEPSEKLLRKWGRHRLIYPHYYKLRFNNLKRKLSRLINV